MAAETVIKMADRSSSGEGQKTIEEVIAVLSRRMAETDAADPEVFQAHMWLAMSLAGNQTAFAEEHGYQPGTVSRWANGSKAPPPLRRGPILRDAFSHLQAVREGASVVTPGEEEETDAPKRRGRPGRK